MSNWAAIASLATALGTLVLAVATFAAVRSANRSAQVAERSLQVALRPLLMPSRLADEHQKVNFGDGKLVVLPGGCAVAENESDVVYLTASLRNVGPGIAIIHGWVFHPERQRSPEPPPLADFRQQARDLYIAPGEVGFWQGAFRDSEDPQHALAWKAIEAGNPVSVDLLYGDYEGGQRVITRFGLNPRTDNQGWLLSASRHWHIDRPEPRNHQPVQP